MSLTLGLVVHEVVNLASGSVVGADGESLVCVCHEMGRWESVSIT